MSYYEKPKGMPQEEADFRAIIREFYWQLFIRLMMPALFLGTVLMTPVIISHHLPDRLNATCTAYEGDFGLRIVSETTRTNLTSYYWTNNRGVSWQEVHVAEYEYQSARANCDVFNYNDGLIAFYEGAQAIIIYPDGYVIKPNYVSLGTSITDIALSTDNAFVTLTFDNKALLSVSFTHPD